MTGALLTRHGPKLGRLLQMREMPAVRDLVPKLYPLEPLPAASSLPDGEPRLAAYREALAAAHPELAQAVADACGPAPWIVRSSGNEDGLDQVNAGAYESLICKGPQDLLDCIARVALSGWHEHAQRQQALSGQGTPPGAIASFVQQLLDIAVAPAVQAGQSPLLADEELQRMEAIGADLMAAFGFAAIDCEWGLQTDQGFVSVTTVMPRDRSAMHTAHTLGFGFASAQNTGDRPTSLALRVAGTHTRLWRAAHLRQVSVTRLSLLQARPAHLDPAHRDREVLTEDCHAALVRRCKAVPAALLTLGAAQRGRHLLAPTLATAWRSYIALEEGQRAAVAVVLVDEGSAEEHAGIMFRQQRMTCLKLDTRQVPAGSDAVVFDRGLCLLGDAAMLLGLRTEVRRELVLPGDCALVFGPWSFGPAATLHAGAVQALESLRALPLADEVRAGLLARSEQPQPGAWMETDSGGIESPSLLGQALRAARGAVAIGQPAVLDAHARAYVQAWALASSNAQLGAVLPRLQALSGEVLALSQCRDLRVPLALLDCETQATWVPAPLLQSILATAAACLRLPDALAAQRVLASAGRIAEECELLPIYQASERVELLRALVDAQSQGLPAAAWAAVDALELPAPAAALLATQALRQPGLLPLLEDFRQATSRFRGDVYTGDASAAATQMNEAFAALAQAGGKTGVMPTVSMLLKGSLIEAYDASLKSLLVRVVEQADVAVYQRYLLVMRAWVDWLRQSPAAARDDVALGRLQQWLAAWQSEAMPDSFEIEDRNWRYEFAAIAKAGEQAARYENPHVVHNLVHQWALAGVAVDAQILPARLRELQHFCSTFSSRSTKVLRFERGLFEIEIPMGTHKASFVFTPGLVAVEWTEPPDCPGDEIARVLAFETLLERYRTWLFGDLTVRREQVLGTWTLFVRVATDQPPVWQWTDYRQFVAAMRLLFDASYDFSYVDNGVVEGLEASVARAAWEPIFRTLVHYRLVLEDTAQYVALHTLPMSSTISSISQSAVLRGLLLRLQRSGAEACKRLIDAYARWLDTGEDTVRWRRRYEHLRQACLYMAAAWPDDALRLLADTAAPHVGHELVAACLFKRTDLRAALLARLAQDAPSLQGLYALVLRHAPEVLVTPGLPPLIVSQLAGLDSTYRRGKHMVLADAAEQLDERTLEALVRDTDTVPHGRAASGERRLCEAIHRVGPRYRYALERGVDWATLDGPQAVEA
jgi:hypothetical protein